MLDQVKYISSGTQIAIANLRVGWLRLVRHVLSLGCVNSMGDGNVRDRANKRHSITAVAAD